jgi:uncharacterized protein YjiS (DUF1127 family)
MNTLKAKQFHLIEDMDISALTLTAIERVEGFKNGIVNLVQTWVRRSNDRRMLTQMSDRMLNDIGLTYHEVATESAKHFWQK